MKKTFILLTLSFSLLAFSKAQINDFERSVTILHNSATLDLDSVVGKYNGKKYYRDEFKYDAYGRTISSLSSRWDSNGNISRKDSSEYAYDKYGTVSKSISYSWDKKLNKWIEDLRFIFENGYDENGNLVAREHSDNIGGRIREEYYHDNQRTTNTSYVWDWTAGWVYKSKHETIYDENGITISIITYTWDKNKNNWQGGSAKMEYEYTPINDNEEISSRLLYLWSNEKYDWVAYEKEIGYKNEKERLSQLTYSYWNNETSDWDNNHKYDLKYNSDNNLDTSISYVRNSENTDWIADQKEKYEYNQKGKETSLYLRRGIVQ